MGNFDNLYKKIMESMVMGGAESIMGNPASGIEIGSTGGAVGNGDTWNPNDQRIAKPLFPIQRRNLGKSKKKRSNS
jgi:hypothetical protein